MSIPKETLEASARLEREHETELMDTLGEGWFRCKTCGPVDSGTHAFEAAAVGILAYAWDEGQLATLETLERYTLSSETRLAENPYRD